MHVGFPPISIVNGGVEGGRLADYAGLEVLADDSLERQGVLRIHPALRRNPGTLSSPEMRIGFGEFILTRKVPLTRFKPCRF
jgi:hypothetical protein